MNELDLKAIARELQKFGSSKFFGKKNSTLVMISTTSKASNTTTVTDFCVSFTSNAHWVFNLLTRELRPLESYGGKLILGDEYQLIHPPQAAGREGNRPGAPA